MSTDLGSQSAREHSISLPWSVLNDSGETVDLGYVLLEYCGFVSDYKSP